MIRFSFRLKGDKEPNGNRFGTSHPLTFHPFGSRSNHKCSSDWIYSTSTLGIKDIRNRSYFKGGADDFINQDCFLKLFREVLLTESFVGPEV